MTYTDPRERWEIFLKAIVDGDVSNLPDPICREEIFISAIARRLAKLSLDQTKLTDYESSESKEIKEE